MISLASVAIVLVLLAPQQVILAAPSLKIGGGVVGARVYVNDNLAGIIRSGPDPLEITGLAERVYRIRITAEGFDTWERDVSVIAGQPNYLEVDMSRTATDAAVYFILDLDPKDPADVLARPDVRSLIWRQTLRLGGLPAQDIAFHPADVRLTNSLGRPFYTATSLPLGTHNAEVCIGIYKTPNGETLDRDCARVQLTTSTGEAEILRIRWRRVSGISVDDAGTCGRGAAQCPQVSNWMR